MLKIITIRMRYEGDYEELADWIEQEVTSAAWGSVEDSSYAVNMSISVE